jgi:Tfp pilus assembly protein PilN
MIRTGVGIELAGKDLRIAAVRSSFGRLRLLRYESIPDFADLQLGDQKAVLAKLVKQHGIPSSRVFLSLPRDCGVLRQMEFPAEVGDKLRSVIALQLETLCPWPADDVYWDFAKAPSKQGGKPVSVNVAIIPRTALDPWIEFFREVKLPLSGATLSSLSCAHAAAALWNDAAPTIILSCEESCVEGTLVQGGRLSSMTLKGETLMEHAQAVVERLIAQGRVSSPSAARLVVHGAEAARVSIDEMPALPIEDTKSKAAEGFGAIAASIGGVRRTPFEVNLTPKHLRYRRSRLQLAPTYALLVLALLLGGALLVRNPYQLMVYASRLDGEIQTTAPQVRDVSLQEAQLNNLSQKHRALVAHFQSHDRNLEALRELARSLPPSSWLSSYSYQDGTITLSGFADAASEVQRALEDNVLFKDVLFTAPVTRDSSGKDRFTLKAAIEVAP